MEYKFKTENEITNCIICNFKNHFSGVGHICLIAEAIISASIYDDGNKPNWCPLQKVEEAYENKCCNTCDNQKCKASEEPCLSCRNHATEWINWKPRTEITN